MEEITKGNDSSFVFVETNEKEAEKIESPKYSYWESVWRTFAKSKVTIFFLFVILAII